MAMAMSMLELEVGVQCDEFSHDGASLPDCDGILAQTMSMISEQVLG